MYALCNLRPNSWSWLCLVKFITLCTPSIRADPGAASTDDALGELVKFFDDNDDDDDDDDDNNQSGSDDGASGVPLVMMPFASQLLGQGSILFVFLSLILPF